MKKYLIIITLLILSSFCMKNKNPLSPSDSSYFSIYLLKDSDMTYHQAAEQDLDKLEMQDEPWLSSNDIYMYDFSTHYIYLNIEKDTLFKDMIDESFIFYNFLLKPFILVASQERVYLGSFISSFSSIACTGPYISDLEHFFYPSDILPIHCYDIDNEFDIRNDPRIKNSLLKLNLFHEGLSITLNNVHIITNSDTSTIGYSFTVFNNDQDNLLIPDPDLMGSELFHYYTNGVEFRSSDNKYYYSQYKSTNPPNPRDSWEPSWFIELKSNNSIQRSVQLKGYPKLPKGTYNCYFKYAGPYKIDQDDRTDSKNRRYWIGNIKSNKISLTIK